MKSFRFTRRHYFSIALIGILYPASTTFAQEITSAYVDSIVEHSMELMPQAGLAVAVIADGKVIHSKGYGVTSIESGEKVNEHTLFSIASNSKAFTTMALGMLVDEGKLGWNDKVTTHIPEFKMYDDYVTEHFTIVDLVTHRSGMGLGAGDLMFIPDGHNFTVDDVVKSFQYQEPVSEFRTKYDYNNLLYITAGEVVARVSGMSWDQFVEQRIMQPLEMNRSAGYRETLKDNSNVAKPHSSEGGKLTLLNEYQDPNKLFGPAGGIYSSVHDLSKWMLMHLNSGKDISGLPLISSENQHKMWKAHTMMNFSATPDGGYRTHYKAYGLGWSLTDQMGYTIVSHTGGMPGMLSQVLLIPELNAGVVVLTNAAPGGYSYYAITNTIKDQLIQAKNRDLIGEMSTWIEDIEEMAEEVVDEVWKTVKKASKENINSEDYLGTYRDDWFGEVTVSEKDDKLIFASKRSPKLTGEMFYYKANTFAIKWDYQEMNCDAFAIFSLDEKGKAQRIEMKGISPSIDFSFDFHDLDLQRIKE